jgi:hypothetical protein
MVQVSGGTLARSKQRRPAGKIKAKLRGKIGSTQFFEQGLTPCSFFAGLLRCRVRGLPNQMALPQTIAQADTPEESIGLPAPVHGDRCTHCA